MLIDHKSNKMYVNDRAFHLMWYRCEICGTQEQIWNSRDGQAPQMVGCVRCDRAGVNGMMRHVRWDEDTYLPGYQPIPGQRIFIDCTAKQFAKDINKIIEIFWEHPEVPMSAAFPNRYAAKKHLMKQWKPGTPKVITWEP